MKLLPLLLALALTACGGGSCDDGAGAMPDARSTAPAHGADAAQGAAHG